MPQISEPWHIHASLMLPFKSIAHSVGKYDGNMLVPPSRVPSYFLWQFTSLSSLTRPTSTRPGPMHWAGPSGFSVYSWFLCGSYLSWVRWKGQSVRYVHEKHIQTLISYLKVPLEVTTPDSCCTYSEWLQSDKQQWQHIDYIQTIWSFFSVPQSVGVPEKANPARGVTQVCHSEAFSKQSKCFCWGRTCMPSCWTASFK